MKKSIWAVLGLFIAGVVLAEQINAIMFNPSRLGLYQQLRVTKQVKSSGNLTAGTTYVKGDTTASANSYEIVNVNAQKGTVDMRGGETEMVVNGPMNIKGGKAQFTAASTLPQLPTNTWIKADEGGLTMGAVTLNGNGNKFNTGTLRGLELGPNDIPLAPSTCTGALDWVERKAADNSIYKVLAVKGCASGECTKTEESCGGHNYWTMWTVDAENCECECDCQDIVQYNGNWVDPFEGYPCYWKANLAAGEEGSDGGWVYYTGTIKEHGTNGRECNDCRRNLTCEATGVRLELFTDYGLGYYKESVIDALIAQNTTCMRPEDAGGKIYKKENCDTIAKDRCGAGNTERCCSAVRYDCKSFPFSAPWGSFYNGTAPAH